MTGTIRWKKNLNGEARSGNSRFLTQRTEAIPAPYTGKTANIKRPLPFLLCRPYQSKGIFKQRRRENVPSNYTILMAIFVKRQDDMLILRR
jgi:hypothetical protein